MALFQEDLISLLLAQHTKIVTPKTAPTGRPRITLNSHPSHDQAARKATQSISKMLTPAELALRRLQKPPIPIPSAAAVVAANANNNTSSTMLPIGRPPSVGAQPLPPSASAPPHFHSAPRPPMPRPPNNHPPSHSHSHNHQMQQQQALFSRTQAMGSYLNMMANNNSNRPPLAPQQPAAAPPAKREAEQEEPEAETPTSSPVRQLRRPKQ